MGGNTFGKMGKTYTAGFMTGTNFHCFNFFIGFFRHTIFGGIILILFHVPELNIQFLGRGRENDSILFYFGW